MHGFGRFLLGLLFVALCGWASSTPLSAHHTDDGVARTAAITLPSNFIARTIVSGMTLPTDMVILPSGDFLVAEKGVGAGIVSKAQVRLVRDGLLQLEPVLTLNVNAEEDSGLMGIVLDPQFAANSYFYVWYSTGENSLGWDGTSYNRLSRFTFDAATGKASLGSETIIFDKVPWSPIHNGGGLAFDDEGNLLITTGDAGSDPNLPQSHLAQSLRSLNGKVLRIRPLEAGGYEVPSDNPYVGNIGGVPPEIYASGLRNPFRIARRAADQQLYLVDVGHDTWEEVNLLEAGANYGWPYREGKCAFAQRENCTPTPPEFTEPVVSYPHPLGEGGGVTALIFYEGRQWPAFYRGRLFVADYDSDWVGAVDLNLPEPFVGQFATTAGAVVDMEATAEGIYTLSIAEGSIRFIYFDAEDNHPPTVSLKTSEMQGTAPLTVTFTAVAEDEDNDDLLFVWKFGDGDEITTTLPTATHVYTPDGDYLATVQVIDEDDGKSEILSRLIQVYSGARPTIVQENLTNPNRTLYHGGDQFRFFAERLGGEVGLDPVAPYAWSVLLHHNDHAHFLLAEYVSRELLLDIPVSPHALGAPLWYEVQLSMRTANGQIIHRKIELRPQTTTIQVQSWPGPAMILVDQQPQSPETMLLVVVGQEHTLEAPERIVYDQKVGVFRNWVVTPSWPQAGTEAGAGVDAVIVSDRVYTFTAPVEANTYVAFYEYVTSAMLNFIPAVSK